MQKINIKCRKRTHEYFLLFVLGLGQCKLLICYSIVDYILTSTNIYKIIAAFEITRKIMTDYGKNIFICLYCVPAYHNNLMCKK